MNSANSRPISWQISYGEPIAVKGTVITPKSGALSIRLPFWGKVWNLPLAVKVTDGEGDREIPIENSTLQATVAFTALAALALLIIGLLNRVRLQRSIWSVNPK